MPVGTLPMQNGCGCSYELVELLYGCVTHFDAYLLALLDMISLPYFLSYLIIYSGILLFYLVFAKPQSKELRTSF